MWLRVGYYGTAFPFFVRNKENSGLGTKKLNKNTLNIFYIIRNHILRFFKQLFLLNPEFQEFIYRGLEFEKIGEFIQRLLKEFPKEHVKRISITENFEWFD